jgi:protein SCO1/2
MKKLAWLACLVVALFSAVPAHAQIAQTPRELQHVGVTEHLDGPLPLDTPFVDDNGKPVTLRAAFADKKPVVLQFAYHTCPVVCGMITTNLAAGLKDVPWTIGQQYNVVTISIDPNESLEKTKAKRAGVLADYGRGLGPPSGGGDPPTGGWFFLKGTQASIEAVTKAAGFEYQYDERQKQWGHPSVVFIVKPDGTLARYLYGLEFPGNDLKLGLFEASEGRSISTVEQIILYCYHYDPQGGKYVLVATRVMQVGGGLTALVLFSVLGMLWANEFRKAKKAAADEAAKKTPTELAEAL